MSDWHDHFGAWLGGLCVGIPDVLDYYQIQQLAWVVIDGRVVVFVLINNVKNEHLISTTIVYCI